MPRPRRLAGKRGRIAVAVASTTVLLAVAAPPPADSSTGAAPLPGTEPGLKGGGADAGDPPVEREKGDRRRVATWHEVGQNAGPTYNCVGSYYEELGRAWAGWFGDIGVSPQTDDVYYVKAGWGISGFPCGTGGARVHVEMVLPAYTRLAISQNTRVRCFYKSPQQANAQEFTQDCPQSPGTGWNGGPSFDPPGEAAWPSATGSLFEIWVPVKTSQPLNGIQPPDGTPCTTCLYVGTWMIDGSNSPWVWPKVPVYVTGTGSTPANPSVNYPAPSVGSVTYDTNLDRVTGRFYANIFTEGTGGTAQFEMGPSKGNYTASGDSIAIPTGGNWQAFEDWGMTPGRTWHWRLCYRPTGQNERCGADQTFDAAPNTAISASKLRPAKRKATFSFTSPPVPNMTTTFQCKLDGGAFRPCTSPKTFSRLSRGDHEISVRAVDQDGHKDATPAKQSFKI